jgi:hypothetical protein
MFDDVLVHKSIDAIAKRRIIVDRSAPAKPSFTNPAAGTAPNQ